MDPVVVTSAVTALATTVATKSLESPLKSFNNLWDGIIGHRIAAWSEQRNIEAFKNVESFKQDLANEVNKIPYKNIQDPQISIVGPTLEASKYYFDEEKIRIMFAKIIASSMDSRKNGYVHHSFVEIVKQLSYLDAVFLKKLYEAGGEEKTYVLVSSNFYGSDSSFENQAVLDNLTRLGLLTEITKDMDIYYYPPSRDGYFQDEGSIEIDKNYEDKYTTKISSFGKKFCEICI